VFLGIAGYSSGGGPLTVYASISKNSVGQGASDLLLHSKPGNALNFHGNAC
jgi:hypothetical protein